MISGTPFLLADVDAEWHRIGPLVQGVDPRDNAGDDLRRCCREGSALCLISSDGVLVVSLHADRYGSGELELFVRLAASWSGPGTIQRNDAHLDAIAKEMGAVKIVFQTRRSGMMKILMPEWRLMHTTFERDVKC